MKDEIKKLYIEPTSHCNLKCAMCSRNCWTKEIAGHMEYSLFEKAMMQVPEIKSLQTIFFGGIGEPLVQPVIIDMVKAAARTGRQTELITNGTMLSEEVSEQLTAAGLNRLWVSVDSVDEGDYADIRGGAEFKSLTDNLAALNKIRDRSGSGLKLGISFVLMKKNVCMLGELPYFARRYRVSDIKVTNLLPYSEEMTGEILYEWSLSTQYGQPSYDVNIDLPIFDIGKETAAHYGELAAGIALVSGLGISRESKAGYCRFVQEGNIVVRWDGEVSPCLALLHSTKTFLYDHERFIEPVSFGNIRERSLTDIWESEKYSSFRERVKKFDFSPCTVCGGCDELDSNMTDCYGNPFPVCGGCLWAQGFIQCP